MRPSIIAILVYSVTAILLFFLSEYFYHASIPFKRVGMLSSYYLYPYILVFVLLGALVWSWWKKDSRFIWGHYGIVVTLASLMIVLLPVLQPEYTYSEAEDLVEQQVGVHVLDSDTQLLWEPETMERPAYLVWTEDPIVSYIVDIETGEIEERK